MHSTMWTAFGDWGIDCVAPIVSGMRSLEDEVKFLGKDRQNMVISGFQGDEKEPVRPSSESF